MVPHPDFEHIDMPRAVKLGPFNLHILQAKDVDEDFQAVMGSASVLKGLFGDWPAGLTLEGNLLDLAWHEREFTTKRSFAWIVRDDVGTYLGCAYLNPKHTIGGEGLGHCWIVDRPDRKKLVAELTELFAAFLTEKLGTRYQLTMTNNQNL